MDALFLCVWECKRIGWEQVCERGRVNWRMEKYWIFIPPVLWIRHKSTIEKWEEANRTSEGSWCQSEKLTLASEDNLRHKGEGDAPCLFLAWSPALFLYGLEILGFSLQAAIIDMDKWESKQSWGTWRHGWKAWKFLWGSPDRAKGNLRMRT